jgi:hypothetical protein
MTTGGPAMNDNHEVAYLLNEAQALLLCMKADTPASEEIRAEIIAVFRAAKHGQPIPPCPRWDALWREAQ